VLSGNERRNAEIVLVPHLTEAVPYAEDRPMNRHSLRTLGEAVSAPTPTPTPSRAEPSRAEPCADHALRHRVRNQKRANLRSRVSTVASPPVGARLGSVSVPTPKRVVQPHHPTRFGPRTRSDQHRLAGGAQADDALAYWYCAHRNGVGEADAAVGGAGPAAEAALPDNRVKAPNFANQNPEKGREPASWPSAACASSTW